MTAAPEPPATFRPVDRESFAGHPMPRSVPHGLRLELSRAPLVQGAEANLDAWMQMLHDRYDECQQTLVTEHAAFEATFRHVEADGSTWMYHLSLIGENGSGLDTSIPVDAEHDAWARRTKHPGWEELEPMFLLAPQHILDALTTWGRTGTAGPSTAGPSTAAT